MCKIGGLRATALFPLVLCLGAHSPVRAAQPARGEIPLSADERWAERGRRSDLSTADLLMRQFNYRTAVPLYESVVADDRARLGSVC